MFSNFESPNINTRLRGGHYTSRHQYPLYNLHKLGPYEKNRSSSNNPHQPWHDWDTNRHHFKDSKMPRIYTKKNRKTRMRRKVRAAIRASNQSERRKTPYIRSKRIKSRIRSKPSSRIIRQIRNEDIDVCHNEFEFLGQLKTDTNVQSVNTFMTAKYTNAGWPLSTVNYQPINATSDTVNETTWSADSLYMLTNGTDTYNQTTPVGNLVTTLSNQRNAWELGTNFGWRDMLCYAEALFAPTGQAPDLQGSGNNGVTYVQMKNYPNTTDNLRTAIQGFLPSQSSTPAPADNPVGNPNICWPFQKNFYPQDGSGPYPITVNQLFYPNQLTMGDNVSGDNMNLYKLSLLRKARLYILNESIEFVFTNTSEADAKIIVYECILRKEIPLNHSASSPYHEVGALPDPKRLWQLYSEQNHHIDDNAIDFANAQINTTTSQWAKSITSPGMSPMGPYINDVYRVVPHVIYLQGGQTRSYRFKVDYNMGLKATWLHTFYGVPNITRTFMITTCGVNAIGINKAEGLDTLGYSQRVTPPTNIAVKWIKTRRFTKIQDKQKHHLTLRAPIQKSFDTVVQFNEEDDDFQQVNDAQQEAVGNEL